MDAWKLGRVRGADSNLTNVAYGGVQEKEKDQVQALLQKQRKDGLMGGENAWHQGLFVMTGTLGSGSA